MPDQPINPPPQLDGEQPESPDLKLARRIVKGGRDDFAAAYEEYAGAAYYTALSLLRSPPDAEDAVHNVFLSLPRTLRTFEGRGSLKGWICKATARAALMILRQRRRLSEVSLDGVLDDLRTTQAGDPETKIMLERAIQLLPRRFRIPYVLKEIVGFSHAEVAGLLNMTEEASRVRLHRARKRLRDRMQ